MHHLSGPGNREEDRYLEDVVEKKKNKNYDLYNSPVRDRRIIVRDRVKLLRSVTPENTTVGYASFMFKSQDIQTFRMLVE